jgi:hypothetical protein
MKKKNLVITNEMLRRRCPLFNKPKQSEEEYWAQYAELEAKYFTPPPYPQNELTTIAPSSSHSPFWDSFRDYMYEKYNHPRSRISRLDDRGEPIWINDPGRRIRGRGED